jgi:hypothetical protein
MNTRLIVAAALSFAAAGSAFAGEATPDYPQRFVSTLTRAQVQAEALEARRLGLIGQGEHVPVATPEQNERIRLAGLRAIDTMLVAR